MRVGFQIHHDLIDDFKARTMPAEEFVRLFYAAANGEQNYLSKFVKPWNGRLPSNEWGPIRARIFKRDNYTCQYCGIRGAKLECDHVVPLSRGGADEDSNLVTSCFPCNRSKRDKTVGEWMASRGQN